MHSTGTKSFVVNAADANLFLVTAQTQTSDRKGDRKNSSTVFLVDGTLPGIEIHGQNKGIGRTNLYQASVKFNDVILSKGDSSFTWSFRIVSILTSICIFQIRFCQYLVRVILFGKKSKSNHDWIKVYCIWHKWNAFYTTWWARWNRRNMRQALQSMCDVADVI